MAEQVPFASLDEIRAILRDFPGPDLEAGTAAAESSALLPSDAYARAKVMEWLFWEQYSHEPYIGLCRFQKVYLGKTDVSWTRKRSHAAMRLWISGRGERCRTDSSW